MIWLEILQKMFFMDSNFPKYVTTSYAKIEKYLKSKNASINAVNSFEIAYEEYKIAYL